MLRIGIVIVCLVGSLAHGTTLRLEYRFADRWSGDVLTTPGLPRVPVFYSRVLLPYGEKLYRATVATQGSSRTDESAHFEISPFPKPLCHVPSFQTPEPPRFVKGEVFPPEAMGEVTTITKHGYRIAVIPVYPVQYEPAEGRAIYHDRVEILIETEPTREETLYRGLNVDRLEALALTDDTRFLSSYPSLPSQSMEHREYVVIGPAEFLADTESTGKLLEEKQSRGLTTGTRSLEDIANHFTGRDIQEKVRNSIVDFYKNNGTRYVLLVGNGYSSNPTRKLRVNISDGTLLSDFYFGCLDGDYDGNKNNTFGEKNDGPDGGDVDLASEVAVGRAPATSLGEFRTFVQKSLRMQAIPASDSRIWNVLNFGEKLDGSTLGSKLIEQLVTGGQAGTLATQGYSAKAKFNKLYESFSQQFTSNQVIEAINRGEFYTVNHLGHANESYCMRFSSSAIPQLTNTTPFFGITQGCHPGNLKGPNWASKLVLHAGGGAAAMVANSHYGYYNGSGSTDGPSNRYHLAFYDSVFRDSIHHLGKAHFHAKERLIPQVQSDAFIRWVVYETNLLGDPELELKF